MIGGPGRGWRVAGASLAEERSGVGGGGGAPTRCSGSSTSPPARGGPPSMTVRSASRSARWQPGHVSSATWASAWPPRRRGGITRGRVVEDLVQRAEPGDGRGGPGGARSMAVGDELVRGWALAGRFPTLEPGPSQEDRTRSCATSSPKRSGASRAERAVVTSTSRHTHAPARAAAAVRGDQRPLSRRRRSDQGCGASRYRCPTTRCATCSSTSSRPTAARI
jgi:hypothetical protein